MQSPHGCCGILEGMQKVDVGSRISRNTSKGLHAIDLMKTKTIFDTLSAALRTEQFIQAKIFLI